MSKYLLLLVCLFCVLGTTAQKKPAKKPKRYGTSAPIEAPPPKEIFVTVSQSPEFPGGGAAFQKYMLQNIRYPAAAREELIEGTVTARFVVDENGRITRTTLLKNLAGGCGREVMRVLAASPNWTPYRHNGKRIPSVFEMSVKFRLYE